MKANFLFYISYFIVEDSFLDLSSCIQLFLLLLSFNYSFDVDEGARVNKNSLIIKSIGLDIKIVKIFMIIYLFI